MTALSSVDGPRTLEEVQELICEIAGDDRINIGASWTLDLRMYKDIPANQYVPEGYLRFVDDDSRAVFQTQEEQVLAVYTWVSPDINEPLAQSLARRRRLMPPNLDLMMDEEGGPILSAKPRDFDHTVACNVR